MIDEGTQRLHRTWREVLVTGFVGGAEVAMGVLAYLSVLAATHNPLLAGLAFSIGFLALLLGRSELFTEGFLVPVTTVAAKRATMGAATQTVEWHAGRQPRGRLGADVVDHDGLPQVARADRGVGQPLRHRPALRRDRDAGLARRDGDHADDPHAARHRLHVRQDRRGSGWRIPARRTADVSLDPRLAVDLWSPRHRRCAVRLRRLGSVVRLHRGGQRGRRLGLGDTSCVCCEARTGCRRSARMPKRPRAWLSPRVH